MQIDSIGVIGGGAWGTALAETLSRTGRDVVLWAHEADTVADINERHVNRAFLPGVSLDARLRATTAIAELASADAILLVAPVQHARRVCATFAPHLKDGTPVVVCSKGIEQSTGKLMGDVIEEELPGAALAVLSGPSFAADVARGLPAALTLACRREDLGAPLAERLSARHFRLYWSSDITGVELGGSLKNVLAIAAGIVDGKGLGASAHAALVTRGFAEMRRFGEALGARSETLMGLSGLGDLILTCGSPQSRNMSLGRALGQGKSLGEFLAARNSVAEGVATAGAVARIAEARGIDMPICRAVHAIIEGKVDVDTAIGELMSRPLKAED
jgi:glycerol-3-phosphate dehydrogenase (NAD(P)+)